MDETWKPSVNVSMIYSTDDLVRADPDLSQIFDEKNDEIEQLKETQIRFVARNTQLEYKIIDLEIELMYYKKLSEERREALSRRAPPKVMVVDNTTETTYNEEENVQSVYSDDAREMDDKSLQVEIYDLDRPHEGQKADVQEVLRTKDAEISELLNEINYLKGELKVALGIVSAHRQMENGVTRDGKELKKGLKVRQSDSALSRVAKRFWK